jgi:hypothetical protein
VLRLRCIVPEPHPDRISRVSSSTVRCANSGAAQVVQQVSRQASTVSRAVLTFAGTSQLRHNAVRLNAHVVVDRDAGHEAARRRCRSHLRTVRSSGVIREGGQYGRPEGMSALACSQVRPVCSAQAWTAFW